MEGFFSKAAIVFAAASATRIAPVANTRTD